jgi:hypothetical protein
MAFGNPIHADLAQLFLAPTWGFASVKLRLGAGLVPRLLVTYLPMAEAKAELEFKELVMPK